MTFHLATVETRGDQLLVTQVQVADADQRWQGSPSPFRQPYGVAKRTPSDHRRAGLLTEDS